MWPGELVDRSVRASERLQHEVRPQIAENVLASKNIMIPVGNASLLRRYYEKVFENLQQTNCRILAKVYVRLVEPRKQVKFPYNGRKNVAGVTHQLSPDETKPPWWPIEVRHREPDHLHKAERIQLLGHILCELRASHGVTARRLRAADETIRRQISPADRINLLDELYYVREKEEKLFDHVLDANARVSISRDNVPDDLELAIIHNQICIRGSPPGQKSESHLLPRDPLLLSDPIRGSVHTESPGSVATASKTTQSTAPGSFTSRRPAPNSTCEFSPDFDHGNHYSQTSYLYTPPSVPMEQYFSSDLDYESYLPESSQEISAGHLDYPQAKARSRIETIRDSVNFDGFNRVLEGCTWY
ncbi:hypothetical protein N7508_007065 [Penicillium antarcticum]|nr:uncharacterized protein N7508_007065 [Penicillium antarcticum]KAJ5302202.1 hypothetical protein N7508_007065 [Penicillium antarcticum]